MNGLLDVAATPVTEAMIPHTRIMGMPDSAARQDIRDYARRLGLTSVLMRSDEADSWYGYVRTIDLVIENRPLSALVRPLPIVDIKARKLEALVHLREEGQLFARVENNGQFAGIISDRGLTESLFRSTQMTSG